MQPTLVEHLHVVAGQSPRAGVPLLATAAVYVAVVGAGLLAAHELTGLPVRARARLPLISAMLVTYFGLVIGLGVSGQLSLARTTIALALTLVALSTFGLSPRWQLIGGVALAVGQVAAAYEGGTANTAAVAVHLVAAAVWVGGVAHLALFGTTKRGRPRLGVAIKRFSKYAVASSVILVGTGVLLLVVHGIGLGDLATSSFGNLVVVKVALLAFAAALGLAHRRGRPWPALAARRDLLRVEAGVLASALAFGAVLAETALPQQALASAGPGIAIVNLGGGQSVDLFASAQGSGAVVQLLSDWPVQIVDRSTGETQQLSPGQLTHVQLRDGVASLQLTSGDDARTVSIRPAKPVTDESLDYQLGRAVALGGGGQLPSSSCPVPDLAVAGAAFSRALRAHHTRSIAVVTDASADASALLDGMTRGGMRFDQRSHEVLIATSEPRARGVLRRLARRGSTAAIYLAPWLLDGRVLSLLTSLQLPPVAVAATDDVMSPLADRYRAALSAVADGVAPSIDGLRGYESVASPDLREQSLTLYDATPIGFLPGVLDVGHDHGSDGGWFTSGTLVPVTEQPIDLGVKCPSRTAAPGRAGLA